MTIEENFRFDTRIRQRMLNKGLISREEVDARLVALPDREDEAVFVELEQPAVATAQDEGSGK